MSIMRTEISRGRKVQEAATSIRNEFQVDVSKIVDSKEYALLQAKTHAFLVYEEGEYLDRFTHIQTVTRYARTAARVLGLNEDLVEAIATGCDLGGTPYGIIGEQLLSNECPDGFSKNKQGHKIARKLNLTHETCEGILNNKPGGKHTTPEGELVQNVYQAVAYEWRIKEALKTDRLSGEDRVFINSLGKKRLETIVQDMVERSQNGVAPPMKRFCEVGEFCKNSNRQNTLTIKYTERAKEILSRLVERFKLQYEGKDIWQGVFDYITGMTDLQAVEESEQA